MHWFKIFVEFLLCDRHKLSPGDYRRLGTPLWEAGVNACTVVLGFTELGCRLTRHVHVTEMIRRHSERTVKMRCVEQRLQNWHVSNDLLRA